MGEILQFGRPEPKADEIIEEVKRITLKNVTNYSTFPLFGTAIRATYPHSSERVYHVVAEDQPFSRSAIEEMCRIVEEIYTEGKKLSAAIIDPQLTDTIEGKTLKDIAAILKIPFIRTQVLPYSLEVAQITGIKRRDAELAAIHTDFLALGCRGKERSFVEYIVNKYSTDDKDRETIENQLDKILFHRMKKNPVAAEKDRRKKMEILTAAANLRSSELLGEIEKAGFLNGNILVLTGVEQGRIFDPDLRLSLGLLPPKPKWKS